jgi:3-phosphoshikimate 1-carboxyvinyltransferase
MAPVAIQGRPLTGIHYQTPVASAQVKSAILLAGLYAEGETSVTEPAPSRDHTERMLRGFGANIRTEGTTVVIGPGALTGCEVEVPGDISSAAFFLAAGAALPISRVNVQNVGLTPTRTGILDVLTDMGARVTISNERDIAGEPRGDITVEAQDLHGITIGGDMIPRLVDEIPVLAVVAALAEGKTVIRDAAELKVKESNRLLTTAEELRRFGVDTIDTADGLVINGGQGFTGAVCQSHGDHRIAMACALMGLASDGNTVIKGAECIAISFPGFSDILESL